MKAENIWLVRMPINDNYAHTVAFKDFWEAMKTVCSFINNVDNRTSDMWVSPGDLVLSKKDVVIAGGTRVWAELELIELVYQDDDYDDAECDPETERQMRINKESRITE